MTSPQVFLLRGTIAHRAVPWPFSRPCTGTWLERYRDHRALQAETDITMDVLEHAIREAWRSDRLDAFRRVEALLNPNGPSDEQASFAQISSRLDQTERTAVLDDLRETVRNGAQAVEGWIRSRGLLGDELEGVWSEAPLVAVTGRFLDVDPSEGDGRVDLVGFRASGSLEVVDLKFGNRAPPDWVVARDRAQVRRYVRAVRRRVDERRRVSGRLLYVGRGRASPGSTPWASVDL